MRIKYTRKPGPVSESPQNGENELSHTVAKNQAIEPIPGLQELVVKLKAEGYAPTHWVVHPKGVRAEFAGPGKVTVPSQYTKARVCMLHGNLVKVRQETFPDRTDRGIRILDVLPCPFCTPDPVRAILRSPVNR